MIRRVQCYFPHTSARLQFPTRLTFNSLCIRHYANSPPKKESTEPIQFPEYNQKTYGADVKKFSQLPVNFGANQHISIDDALKEKLRGVLWKFNAPIRYAFAYGSGVFQQSGADSKSVFTCSRMGLTLDADGGFYIWSIAYAALAWIESGSASGTLLRDEAIGKWCYKLAAGQFWCWCIL
jgi:hypothetical protein